MKLALVVALMTTAASSWAQPPTGGYAGMESRPIKALSEQQVADLREGKGMGASLPAELNGVPGPLHVLQLKDQLSVTPDQEAALRSLTAEMKASAQKLGEAVIQAEQELDASFKNKSADEPSIRHQTQRIGALNAELRALHLLAHVKTRQVLSERQVAAYNLARGYVAGSAEAPAHRHHH